MKTKEELFRIYSAYLPYNLEIRYKDCLNSKLIRKATLSGITKTEIETTYKRKIKHCAGDIISWDGHNNVIALEVKPILYSKEMLIKEIEHNGEKFIPANWFGRTQINQQSIISNSYTVVNQLIKWKFNVFGLSESDYIKKENL